MSVKQLLPAHKPLRDACLDLLQMLSGAALVIFMVMHMLLVSSSLLSASIMDSIAHFLEATYLAQLGGVSIFLLLIGHFLLVARKIPFVAAQQETLWTHAKMLHHQDTWLWLVQVVTGMCILLLATVHIWAVFNNLPITTNTSATRIQSGLWLLFYLAFLPLIELHLFIGVYRIGVKWGYIGNALRHRATRLLFYGFVGFVLLGFISIIHFYYINIIPSVTM